MSPSSASKDVDAAEDLKKEAKSRGLSLGLFKADVTQFDQVKGTVEGLRKFNP
jgi:hypothetical protein